MPSRVLPAGVCDGARHRAALATSPRTAPDKGSGDVEAGADRRVGAGGDDVVYCMERRASRAGWSPRPSGDGAVDLFDATNPVARRVRGEFAERANLVGRQSRPGRPRCDSSVCRLHERVPPTSGRRAELGQIPGQLRERGLVVIGSVVARTARAPADESGGAGDEVARHALSTAPSSRRRTSPRHRGLMLASVDEGGQTEGIHLGATAGTIDIAPGVNRAWSFTTTVCICTRCSRRSSVRSASASATEATRAPRVHERDGPGRRGSRRGRADQRRQQIRRRRAARGSGSG